MCLMKITPKQNMEMMPENIKCPVCNGIGYLIIGYYPYYYVEKCICKMGKIANPAMIKIWSKLYQKVVLQTANTSTTSAKKFSTAEEEMEDVN